MEIVRTRRRGCFSPSCEEAGAHIERHITTARKQSSSRVIVHSILRRIHPKRSTLFRTGGHRQIEPIAFFVPEAGTRADCSRNFGQRLVMIRVNLLDYADEPFSSGYVEALPAGVVIDIVGVGNTRHARNQGSGLGVEHYHLSWLPRHHEEAMI